MYYKTGLLSIEQNGLGISGQQTLIIGVTLAVIISSTFRLLLAGPVGVATVTAVVYSLSIYATHIGIRKDVAKVPVEDLAINLGWSTGRQLSFAESFTTPATIYALRRNISSTQSTEDYQIVEGPVPK